MSSSRLEQIRARTKSPSVGTSPMRVIMFADDYEWLLAECVELRDALAALCDAVESRDELKDYDRVWTAGEAARAVLAKWEEGRT